MQIDGKVQSVRRRYLPSRGQISDERSRDMAGLNKHGNQAVVTHVSGLVVTSDISH